MKAVLAAAVILALFTGVFLATHTFAAMPSLAGAR